MHLRKCILEQHSVTFRILTSNYLGEIGLWLFGRPTVSQSRHVDDKLSSWICIPNFATVNSITIRACRYRNILVKLKFHFSDDQQYRNLAMSISNYPHKTAFRFFATVDSIATCACQYRNILVKLKFHFSDGQQYRNLGMLISKCACKIEVPLFWWSIVSQSRHVDIRLHS